MNDAPRPTRYRRGSLVWPILLIGAGVIFLLANLGILPANSWAVIARFWPVALILIGLDVLIGWRSRAGMVISALIALALVAGLITILLLAPNIPALNRLTGPAEIKTKTLQAPLAGAQTARVHIDWSPGQNRLMATSIESANLIEAQVAYIGSLVFDVNKSGSHSDITLDDRFVSTGFTFLNWQNVQWNVALHPGVIYDLSFDTGSGRSDFNLADLQLSGFTLDSGSGSVSLSLPSGNYRAVIDGGSGSIDLTLPSTAAARVELESGSGSFSPAPALKLVSGEANGDGVWETENFNQAAQRVTLVIDQGSGSLRISNE